MLEIIAGVKGKGKTPLLIQNANDAVKLVQGSIVYLDKSNKHMYELSNKIRMINVRDFDIEDSDMFVGFLLGIVSQDHDLDTLYLDSFLTIGHVDASQVEPILRKLSDISDKFKVKFVLSMSMEASDLPEFVQDSVIAAL